MVLYGKGISYPSFLIPATDPGSGERLSEESHRLKRTSLGSVCWAGGAQEQLALGDGGFSLAGVWSVWVRPVCWGGLGPVLCPGHG